MQRALKTLLIEDSESDLKLLKHFFGQYPKLIQLWDEHAPTVERAAEILSQNKFQLTIIDYTLEDGNWYDLIEAIGIRNMGIIVLHTIKKDGSFERTERARDYMFLKKTLNSIVMAEFVTRLEKRIEEDAQFRETYRYKILDKKLEIHLFDEDIILIEAFGNYSVYYCIPDKQIPAKLTHTMQISQVELTLNPAIFVRCHESYIVNKRHIRKLGNRNKKGGGVFYLTNGCEIPFTITYREQLAGIIND